MANDLVTSSTVVRKQTVHYSVSEVTNPTLYASILAGTSNIPPNSFVTLITTGGVRSTRITPDISQTWDLSEAITLTTSSVSDALKAKTAINALALVTTPNATGLITAQDLANANKVAINAVINALKS